MAKAVTPPVRHVTTPLKAYLHSISEIHASGTALPETSYYGSLEQFLNAIGKGLTPRVRCVIGQKFKPVIGSVDGGLFTPDQFLKSSAVEPKDGALPARGA